MYIHLNFSRRIRFLSDIGILLIWKFSKIIFCEYLNLILGLDDDLRDKKLHVTYLPQRFEKEATLCGKGLRFQES